MTNYDEFMDSDITPSSSLFKGRVVDAEYVEQSVPSYRNNPLTEAMPPEFDSDKEVAKALLQKPDFSPNMRNLSPRNRIHATGDLEDQFFQPLPHHLELQLKISRMIRRGYVMRNPATPGFFPQMQKTIDSAPSFVEPIRLCRPKALGFNLIGPSGIGKSYSLESMLFLFPQVIRHRLYKGSRFTHLQLGWLKLDCPYDGLLSGLAPNFFEAVDDVLGTSYTKIYMKSRQIRIDALLRGMARVAAIHFLGALVIDEIQVLRAMRSENSEKMLNFFVNLVNTIGVPVLLVGTDKARQLFESKPRQARRGTGQGSEVWYLMRNDGTWQVFLNALFKYQYVQQPVELSTELRDVLFDETQGITDLVVKLYVQSQIRAIRTGHETLTPAIVRSVALDSFQMLRPVIVALKRGDKRALAELEDIYPFWREEYARRSQQEEAPINVSPVANDTTTTTSQTNSPSGTTTQPHEQPEDQAGGQTETTSSKPPARPRGSRASKNQTYALNSLMSVVAQGKGQKLTPYQALHQAGHIFSFEAYVAQDLVAP